MAAGVRQRRCATLTANSGGGGSFASPLGGSASAVSIATPPRLSMIFFKVSSHGPLSRITVKCMTKSFTVF